MFSLCCTQSTESEKNLGNATSISFKVNDGIEDGFEGYDQIEIEMTEGSADEVLLVYKPAFQATVTVALTSSDNITFNANVNFGAFQTEWFIAASSATSTTQYGASNDLLVTQKYLNKNNADQLISNLMNEKRSSSEILDYRPNSIGNTTSLSVNIDGTPTNVDLDHLVYIPTFNPDFSALHAQYAIEYNTTLNGSVPSTNTTDTYGLVASDRTQDMGYIIIASTDRGNMERILSNGSFLKDAIFLSELTGDNLQLIQY